MNLSRYVQSLCLNLKRTATDRANYLRKKQILGMVGKNVSFSPRMVPLYPKLIKLHDNVNVAAGVRFITHDVTDDVINEQLKNSGRTERLTEKIGCIEIMDNVFVGADSIILYDVRIGPNAIIGAGSIVTKDIPPNSIAAGVPAKVIGRYDDFVQRRLKAEKKLDCPAPIRGVSICEETVSKYWEMFEQAREK